MKILILGNTAFTPFTLAKNLSNRNIDVTLVCKEPQVPISENYPWLKIASGPAQQFNALNLNIDDYDLIHCNYLLNWFSLGARIRKSKTPILFHAHGSDTRPHTPIHKWLLNYILKNQKHLLYSTPDLLQNINFFEGQKYYVPNPINIPENISAEDKFSDRILIYTTLNPVKKTEELLPIIKELSQYQFDIINLGKYENIKQSGLDNINLIDAFEKDKVYENLSRYPLILGGSQDGTIRVCELEALASEVPTLFPFTYDSFYKEALPMLPITSENINNIMKDPSLLEGQKAWVQESHSVDIVADQLLEIYSKVIS